MPAETAYQLVHDELQVRQHDLVDLLGLIVTPCISQGDGSTSLNLATFVTTYMEPQAEKLMMETLAKNIIDAVSPDDTHSEGGI